VERLLVERALAGHHQGGFGDPFGETHGLHHHVDPRPEPRSQERDQPSAQPTRGARPRHVPKVDAQIPVHHRREVPERPV